MYNKCVAQAIRDYTRFLLLPLAAIAASPFTPLPAQTWIFFSTYLCPSQNSKIRNYREIISLFSWYIRLIEKLRDNGYVNFRLNETFKWLSYLRCKSLYFICAPFLFFSLFHFSFFFFFLSPLSTNKSEMYLLIYGNEVKLMKSF